MFPFGQSSTPGSSTPSNPPVMAAADDAEYQKYLTDKRAAAQAAEATKMSVGDVLHRLIDAVGWNHTAERDAAHVAVTDATPKDSTTVRDDRNARQPGETFASDTSGTGVPQPFNTSARRDPSSEVAPYDYDTPAQRDMRDASANIPQQRDAAGNVIQRDAAGNVIQRDASVPQPFNPNVP